MVEKEEKPYQWATGKRQTPRASLQKIHRHVPVDGPSTENIQDRRVICHTALRCKGRSTAVCLSIYLSIYLSISPKPDDISLYCLSEQIDFRFTNRTYLG
jgi:hypothetical protein